MRAFAGWGAPLLLLLLLSCGKPLSSSNASSWGSHGGGGLSPGPAMDVASGFCGVRDDAGGGDSQGWFSGECAAEGVCGAIREEEEDGVGHVRALGEVDDEYIVRFKEYRYAGEFRRALEERLEGNGRVWQWLERNNPASAFPTDFGLLRIRRTQYEVMLEALRGLEFVKDVSPQMRFSRALMSESGETEQNSGTGREDLNGRCDVSDLEGVEEVLESKPPGRLRTKLSCEDEFQDVTPPLLANVSLNHGRSLLLQRSQITSMFESEKLWAKGFTGAKVRMAVFDTGVRADHPHFRNIKERTNWTNEDTLNDNLGHGTFVAGVISSQDPQCLGFAPDAEIYAFRVFTDAQVSYTSWFLDAFNYAIATKMNVLNLSIGGPDYLDLPFVEKVWEMTANNIIMVSAIGNDGPLYGTLNNPADQSDVIGVGGIDYSDHIASFSSRGMSTWEIPHGYGRVKPDIVAYGREVVGSKISTGCKSLSGTSVASPVVAGAVCLLASVIPEKDRWKLLNPASMKQALVEGALRLSGPNMFEQGAGRLNLLKSYEILATYKPRVSILPSALDLTDSPYAWPFWRQALYAGAMPLIFNATILNGMGVVGYIDTKPTWEPFEASGSLLDIQYTYSDVIWPWTGFLGLHLRVKPEGTRYQGTIEGKISFSVVSPPARGESSPRKWDCELPLKVSIIPTPPREKRILWDQFHSVRYPPGYIPRDSLDVRNDILDWHGDHLHTNYHGMFDALRDAGYFVETLGSPLTCFDATQYGTLLMVDLEDEYYSEEIEKLQDDVKMKGLGLIVFADWYHVETMVKMKFFDDNTRSWWTPATGGANIPALNDLLAPFGIAFGDTILNGPYSIGGERAQYASGTDILRFPAGGFVHRFLFQDSSGGRSGITSSRSSVRAQVESPILGAVEAGRGRIAVYGDSNCLDSSHMVSNCYWLLKKLLDFTSSDIQDPVIFPATNELGSPLGSVDSPIPRRRTDVDFSPYSLVLKHPLRCGLDSPLAVQDTEGYVIETSRLRTILEPTPIGSGHLQPNESTSSDGAPHSMDRFSRKDFPFESNSTDMASNVSVLSLDRETGSTPGVVFPTRAESETNESVPELRAADNANSRGKENSQLPLGLWNRDELDLTTQTAVQWLAPILLCITGFVLILGLWRVRQKKHRRARKGSTRSLLNL
ncbi:hypothetical protein M758_1G278300 [Ceratodon purpureus]|nr:hypothetical protein M758_1G278300 [Ceratodon purpureus]